jgi:hypothetical protein
MGRMMLVLLSVLAAAVLVTGSATADGGRLVTSL